MSTGVPNAWLRCYFPRPGAARRLVFFARYEAAPCESMRRKLTRIGPGA